MERLLHLLNVRLGIVASVSEHVALPDAIDRAGPARALETAQGDGFPHDLAQRFQLVDQRIVGAGVRLPVEHLVEIRVRRVADALYGLAEVGGLWDERAGRGR